MRVAQANGTQIKESPRYWDFLISLFQIFIHCFCSQSLSLPLSQTTHHAVHQHALQLWPGRGPFVLLCFRVAEVFLLTLSPLQWHKCAGLCAWCRCPGHERSPGWALHSPKHPPVADARPTWLTTTARVTKSKGFITDDGVGGIHSLNSQYMHNNALTSWGSASG